MNTNRFSAAKRATRLIPSFCFALAALALLACAQSSPTTQSAPTTGEPRHYNITLADLPPPQVQKGPVNFSKIVPQPAGAELTCRRGSRSAPSRKANFNGLAGSRKPPTATCLLPSPRAIASLILRDSNGDGKVDERFVFATGLSRPFGMAFWKDYLYVGNTDAVIRFAYKPGQTKAEGAPEKIADLPMNGYREHWTRNLIFNADGSKLYVTVGSKSNVDAGEEPMRAAISEFNPDGSGHRILASGTRNPIGLAWNPKSKQLWAAVQERDLIGDDLVPDYVTSIKDGAFYGWPYAYIGQHEDPRRKGERPESCRQFGRPRCVDPSSFGGARAGVLQRQDVSRRLSRRRLCSAAWLLEPLEADRLQDHSNQVQRRKTGRGLRRLHNRMDDWRGESGSVGPSCWIVGFERRLDADHRRRRKQDLARGVSKTKVTNAP